MCNLVVTSRHVTLSPMCNGGQAVCILKSPIGMVSHADADGLNTGWKQDPLDADVETVTVTRTCFTASEQCDIRAIVALLGHASPSLHDPRDVVWPRLCQAMDDWRSAFECRRKETLDGDRTPWVAHAKLYRAGLLGMVLSMRFTRRRWVRRWFWRLTLIQVVRFAILNVDRTRDQKHGVLLNMGRKCSLGVPQSTWRRSLRFALALAKSSPCAANFLRL